MRLPSRVLCESLRGLYGTVHPPAWVVSARLRRTSRYCGCSLTVEDLTPLLNLYRIMTDVRAGSHQRSVAAGNLGIVTLWVRADSEFAALARAKCILTHKRYASIGRLSSYAEALADDPLLCVTEEERIAGRREDSVLAGYEAIKEKALTHADGLHEVWLTPSDHQVVRHHKVA